MPTKKKAKTAAKKGKGKKSASRTKKRPAKSASKR